MELKMLLKSPIILLRNIFMFFLIYLPGASGGWLRYQFYKRRFKSCGKNVRIDVGVIIGDVKYISIGDNVHIDKYCIINAGKANNGKIRKRRRKTFNFKEGELIIGSNIHIAQFCVIMAYGGVQIGNNSAISAGTKIYSLTNTPNDLDDPSKIIHALPFEQAYFLMSPVTLDENVWAGLDCIVMPGVHIRKNSFVASKSIVMGSFPENSYITGNPARRTRERFLNKVT
jgi:acetyltransferase-like isoleucine patch superfamily enzyme